MRWVIVAAVLAAVGAGIWAWNNLRPGPGEPCNDTIGCKGEADCLAFSSGPLPPIGATKGVCYARCLEDSDCPAGLRCLSEDPGLYCFRVAGINELCGAGVPCGDGLECLGRRGTNGRCHRRCITDDDCPGDTACLPVSSGAAMDAVRLNAGFGMVKACLKLDGL